MGLGTQDKKLAIGSRLLQRAVISSLFRIPWNDVKIGAYVQQ